MVSVVVVNWCGERYLRECLDAILAQEPAPAEVIVVDGHSPDRSREVVAQGYPSVRWIDLGGNLGPAAARNRGVREAMHDPVLLVDNDVLLEPGCLRALEAGLAGDRDTGLVQARSVLDADPEVVHYDAADLHYLGMLVLHDFYRPRAAAATARREVGAAVALCVLVRRAAYLDVGGFDESFFFFFEDNDFAYRLRLRGWKLRHDPDAVVRHRGGTEGLSMRGEVAAMPARRTRLHSRNRWLLLLACLHWRTLLLTLPAQVAYGLVHLAFATAHGHLLAWLLGKCDLLRMLPTIWRRRRAVQRGRRRADRDLLIAAPFTFNPQVARGGLGRTVRRVLDAGFVGYWRCVRWACG